MATLHWPVRKGVNFAVLDATGQASELLDDYEEGTWTMLLSHNDNALTLNSSLTEEHM